MGSIEPSAEHERIAALTTQVRRDLARIAHPRMPWLEPRPAPGGTPALDVLIIGAGQSGLAIAFGLMRAQVDNHNIYRWAGMLLSEAGWLTGAVPDRSPADDFETLARIGAGAWAIST